MTAPMHSMERRLVGAALLFIIYSFVLGIWGGNVRPSADSAFDPDRIRAAHLGALMLGLWLIAIAYVYFRYGWTGAGANVAAWVFVLGSVCLTVGDTLGAYWGTRGLQLAPGTPLEEGLPAAIRTAGAVPIFLATIWMLVRVLGPAGDRDT